MPRILYTLDFTPDAPPELSRFGKMIRKLYEQLARIVNGQINFGDGTNRDNIDGAWAAVADTGTANTDFSVSHNLGRIPVGYLTMKASVAVDIYTGSAPWTATTISLRASVAHAAVSLFII